MSVRGNGDGGGTSADTSAHVTEKRMQLRRSREDRVLFGVCGGFGRYLGIDPVLVRVAFVLLAVFGGSGILLYLIAAIAMQADDEGDSFPPTAPWVPGASGVVVGGVLVAVGSLMFASQVIPGFGRMFGPLLLVALGVAVILAGRR